MPTAEPVVDEPAEDEAPVMAAPAVAAARRRGSAPLSVATVVVAGLVTLAVLAAALLAVVTARLSHRLADDGGNSFTSTAAPIVSSAQTELTAALSYDYQTLPEDFARAEKGLTPSFKKNYERTTATAVSGVAKKYKAVTTASVSAIGIVTAETDQATLLAYVDATSKNSNLSSARLDRERVQVQMRKINGHWLIDGLTTL